MTHSTEGTQTALLGPVPQEKDLIALHQEILTIYRLPAVPPPTVPGGSQLDLLDAYLFWADSFHTVPILSMLLVRVMQRVPETGFQQFERRLRRLRSRSFLAANPNQVTGYRFIDVRSGQPTPYFLWICLNGLDEFNRHIRNFGWESYEDNFRRLAETGIMVEP